MLHTTGKAVSRRTFMRTASSAALAAGVGASIIVPNRSRAQQQTLKILQWNHFVPGYDRWFNNTYIKEWGEQHNTQVIVDNIGLAGLNSRAAAEVQAQNGHDLFMFLWPPPVHEDEVIDHREIYEECELQYGKAIDLAIKSTYNPKTNKYYGFSDSYVPAPVNYRKDLWDDIGMVPNSWDDIRKGGRAIKHKRGIPVGIGLASEIDTNMALRALMYAFGSSVQDEASTPVLKSKQTREALTFAKDLYEKTMTSEVFTWTTSSNNRFMLSGGARWLSMRSPSPVRVKISRFPLPTTSGWLRHQQVLCAASGLRTLWMCMSFGSSRRISTAPNNSS